jgi:hypothetical protein
MKCRILLGFVLLLAFAGCGAYQELKPNPPISPLEGSYIELSKSKNENTVEWLELKQDKKYFVRFPAPAAAGYYLVLRTDQKSLMGAYFTTRFSKGKDIDPETKDESTQAGVSVFRLDPSVAESYWVVETVGQDLTLSLDYRYVPIWRYTFENRHAELSEQLAQNRADRTIYNTLGTSYHFTDFDFASALNTLSGTSAQLQTIKQALQDTEKLLPADVINSDDRAYRDYETLVTDTNDEIQFQTDYRDVLAVFQVYSGTRNNIGGFLTFSPMVVNFLNQADRFPQPIMNEARSLLGGHLAGVVPYLERTITAKNEVSKIQFPFEISGIEALYSGSNRTPPQEFQDLAAFINAYNSEAQRLAPAQAILVAAERYKTPGFTWPSNNHYSEALEHIGRLNQIIPEERSASFAQYNQFQCVVLLNHEVNRIRAEATRLGRDFATSQGVVRQVNTLSAQREYRTIVQLLSAYRRLDFLLLQYSDVDQRSLDQQQTAIAASLEGHMWAQAEQRLRGLHEDEVFLKLGRIANAKLATVQRLEGRIVAAVEGGSKERVDVFVEANNMTIDNVDGLYENEAFAPIYTLSFTSGSSEDLARRNTEVQTYLANLKHNVFPSSAIPAIYRDFTRNIKDRGVEKARAIVIHGKHYQGDDQQIKNVIAECDPKIPKWITKAAAYRKVYVLPTTSNAGGENTYLFRLNVVIPSQAKFPVFDINIKLPKEVAQNATTDQWYNYIKLNNEELKPQGRFTITAPTDQNEYEAQLTPVQMRADENNVMEVEFTHPSFQVFEISTMSQRPIMRKD